MSRMNGTAPDNFPTEKDYPPAPYAWYVVGVLLIVGITSYLDRNIIALLVEPIRADLGLSDTEVSFLQGTAFAIFYVAFGLPFGMLADRVNRRTLLALGVAWWSLMTAAGGFAENYWQLFAARAGVGIGEACLAPAAFSILADYFQPARRGRAMSIYNMANYIGGGASLFIGGLVLGMLGGVGTAFLPVIGSIESWKATFILIGTPGLLLSLLMLTVKEPARRGTLPRRESGTREGFIQHMLKAPRVYAAVHFSGAMTAFTGYAVFAWSPTHLVRQFGFEPAEAGVMMGPIAAVCGMLGCIGSGFASDWLVRKGTRGGRFAIPLAWWPIALVGISLIVLSPTHVGALLGVGVFALGSGFGISSVPPTIHDITPNQLRGQATSLHFVLAGLLGLAGGISLVAIVNDTVFRDPASIGMAMLVVLAPVAITCFVICLANLTPYEKVRQACSGRH
jgi:MFS family permease